MTRSPIQAPSAWPAFATAALMLAQFVASKATRDAFFLSEFPASDLPLAMIAAGVVTIAGTAVASVLLARFGPGRIAPWLFFVSALALLGLWGAAEVAPGLVAAALYLHVALFGPLAISGFWSLLNESFDPHSAKTTLARVSAFAAFGGILGGVGANAASSWLGPENVLACLAVLHLGCAFGVATVAGAAEQVARETGGPDDDTLIASGPAVLLRSPFLRRMALLMVVCAAVDGLLDYAFKASAAAAFDAGELIEFFGWYYTVTGVLIFVVQAGVGGHVLRRFGLGGAMGVLPVTILGFGSIAFLWPRLIPITLARAVESIFSNSLFSAGFQLLYTPLPPGDKRPAKPYIDVAAQRAGGIAGGVLIVGLLQIVPDTSLSWVIGIAVAVAAIILWMVVALQRGYVSELERSLRSGTLHITATDALDATTAQTLAGTGLGIDRASLLEQIRARRSPELQDGHAGSLPAPGDQARIAAPDGGQSGPLERLEAALPVDEALFIERARGLLSGDPTRVCALLTTGPPDPRLAPLVIPLLGRDDLDDVPLRHLQKLSTRISGQLLDALLGHDHPLELRRRLPRSLERCPGAGVLPRLSLAFDDPDVVIRLRAAQTAVRMIARAPDLALDRERVRGWLGAALEVDEAEMEGSLGAMAADAVRSVFGGHANGAMRSPYLELFFTLLALSQPLEVVRAAVNGFDLRDPMLRGTALEYLETTLPTPLFRAFFELVRREGEMRPVSPRPGIPRNDAAAELLETSRNLPRPKIIRDE